ncbi:putative matrix metalloproteinase [Betaentomopoxvirus amoorei]|uniref:AMV037 n=1 Tax=Amsacta moorei entomopoxvirus TaxID=28321 RepID=Q9EN11_AMEPV|nr:putative matrix metalloproteinase [Amsacta moorei entomopoxvirus]AAG02743.1 AMV037 [Amsacta moorei entomopoxvirus]
MILLYILIINSAFVTSDSNINICDENIKPNSMTIIDNYLYIFYNENFWKMNLISKYIIGPYKIKSTFKFIRDDEYINLIYQRSDNKIIYIDSDYINIINESFAIIDGLSKLDINNNIKNYNGIFMSNKGKTYIFTFNKYIELLDYNYEYNKDTNTFECNLSKYRVKDINYINKKFYGIPHNINYAFRFIDGNIYFVKYPFVYIYNEFINKLISINNYNLNLFDAMCDNKNKLIKDIKILLYDLKLKI